MNTYFIDVSFKVIAKSEDEAKTTFFLALMLGFDPRDGWTPHEDVSLESIQIAEVQK